MRLWQVLQKAKVMYVPYLEWVNLHIESLLVKKLILNFN